MQGVAQEIANKFATDEDYTHWCMIIKKADYEFDDRMKTATAKFNRYFEFEINKTYLVIWMQASQEHEEWIERNKKVRAIFEKQPYAAYAE